MGKNKFATGANCEGCFLNGQQGATMCPLIDGRAQLDSIAEAAKKDTAAGRYAQEVSMALGGQPSQVYLGNLGVMLEQLGEAPGEVLKVAVQTCPGPGESEVQIIGDEVSNRALDAVDQAQIMVNFELPEQVARRAASLGATRDYMGYNNTLNALIDQLHYLGSFTVRVDNDTTRN